MEDIKGILKEQTEEIERHIDVLKEDFDQKLGLVAESVSGIQEQLIAIKEMVVKNTEDLEIMKGDMMVVKSDTQTIKQGLKRKVDLEEFETLERRVAVLESKNRS